MVYRNRQTKPLKTTNIYIQSCESHFNTATDIIIGQYKYKQKYLCIYMYIYTNSKEMVATFPCSPGPPCPSFPGAGVPQPPPLPQGPTLSHSHILITIYLVIFFIFYITVIHLLTTTDAVFLNLTFKRRIFKVQRLRIRKYFVFYSCSFGAEA